MQDIPNGMGGPQLGQIVLDQSDLEDVTCKECGNDVFVAFASVKRLPPLNPKANGKEYFFTLLVLVCTKCGAELKNVQIEGDKLNVYIRY